MASAKGSIWTDEEVAVLSDTWAEDSVQKQLNTTHRNAEVFSEISRQLNDRGFDRNSEQCRDKVKKVRSQYLKVRDRSGRSGSSADEREKYPWYDIVDRTISMKPSTQPVVLESDSSTPTSSSATELEGSPVDNVPPSGVENVPPNDSVAEVSNISQASSRTQSRKRKSRTDITELMCSFTETQQQQYRHFSESVKRREQRDREHMESMSQERRRDQQEHFRLSEKMVDKMYSTPDVASPPPHPSHSGSPPPHSQSPAPHSQSPPSHPSYPRSPSPPPDTHPSTSVNGQYYNS